MAFPSDLTYDSYKKVRNSNFLQIFVSGTDIHDSKFIVNPNFMSRQLLKRIDIKILFICNKYEEWIYLLTQIKGNTLDNFISINFATKKLRY